MSIKLKIKMVKTTLVHCNHLTRDILSLLPLTTSSPPMWNHPEENSWLTSSTGVRRGGVGEKNSQDNQRHFAVTCILKQYPDFHLQLNTPRMIAFMIGMVLLSAGLSGMLGSRVRRWGHFAVIPGYPVPHDAAWPDG